MHGVKREDAKQLEDEPFEKVKQKLHPTFISKTELPYLVNSPVDLFYEEYTANPEVTTVGDSTGDFTRHQTLIYLGGEPIGSASIELCKLNHLRSYRSEEDYPRLLDLMSIRLFGKYRIEHLHNRNVDYEKSSKYIPYGEIEEFHQIPKDLARKNNTHFLQWEIISYYDPNSFLGTDLKKHDGWNHMVAENIARVKLAPGQFRDGFRRDGDPSEYSILEKHGGTLTNSAIDDLVRFRIYVDSKHIRRRQSNGDNPTWFDLLLLPMYGLCRLSQGVFDGLNRLSKAKK